MIKISELMSIAPNIRVEDEGTWEKAKKAVDKGKLFR